MVIFKILIHNPIQFVLRSLLIAELHLKVQLMLLKSLSLARRKLQ